MAKGIIYICSTVVDGLIKIGKTTDFESRMRHLEKNGYCNVAGLKREFAIEVDDFDDKEALIHQIFSKSRVKDTELFSADINLVKQLLSSLDGKVIYPENEKKEEIFEQATEVVQVKSGVLPDGVYTLDVKLQASKMHVKATMLVKNGQIILKAGAELAPISQKTPASWKAPRESIKLNGNITAEDFPCTSPSMAAAIVCGHAKNGWEVWKDKEGRVIDFYRKKNVVED